MDDIDYLEIVREIKRTIYHSPLPIKKQRTTHYRYQRSGECKVYTKEEIDAYYRAKIQLGQATR
jgi:hypothetical protein